MEFSPCGIQQDLPLGVCFKPTSNLCIKQKKNIETCKSRNQIPEISFLVFFYLLSLRKWYCQVVLYKGNAANLHVQLTPAIRMLSHGEFMHEVLHLLKKPDSHVTSVPRLWAIAVPCDGCNGMVKLGLLSLEKEGSSILPVPTRRPSRSCN